MPSELNRRAVFAAAAAFLLALAVAYALSSTGEASERTGPPGSPADQIDVASGIAGQATLGQAEGLPALVRKPKPEPKPKEPQVGGNSGARRPDPLRRSSQPQPRRPPTPTPPADEPPVEFTDSG